VAQREILGLQLMQVTEKLVLCVVPASPQHDNKLETLRQISGANMQAFEATYMLKIGCVR